MNITDTKEFSLSAIERMESLSSFFRNDLQLDRAIKLLEQFKRPSEVNILKVRSGDIIGFNTYELNTFVMRLQDACQFPVLFRNGTYFEEDIAGEGQEVGRLNFYYSSPTLEYENKEDRAESASELFGIPKTFAEIVLADLYYIRQQRNIKVPTQETVLDISVASGLRKKYPKISIRDIAISGKFYLCGYAEEEIPLGKADGVLYKLAYYALAYHDTFQSVDLLFELTKTDRTKEIIKPTLNTKVDAERFNLLKIRIDDFNNKLRSFNNNNPVILYQKGKSNQICLKINTNR